MTSDGVAFKVTKSRIARVMVDKSRERVTRNLSCCPLWTLLCMVYLEMSS
jgi:hypothetical protein